MKQLNWGDGSTTKITGNGDICLITETHEGKVRITLHDVSFAPEFKINLLSIIKATSKDLTYFKNIR